jgi:hypothetical protein
MSASRAWNDGLSYRSAQVAEIESWKSTALFMDHDSDIHSAVREKFLL